MGLGDEEVIKRLEGGQVDVPYGQGVYGVSYSSSCGMGAENFVFGNVHVHQLKKKKTLILSHTLPKK